MIVRTLVAFGALALIGAVPAAASAPAKDAGLTRAAAPAALTLARHGADDGAGHDKGDDHGKHKRGHASLSTEGSIVLARHGADDGAGHDAGDDHGRRHRGRGKDD